MPIRFRKRVRVLPGVHLNIGKRGVSTSVGRRGASVTFGKDRTTLSAGIPGSGLSHVETSRHRQREGRTPGATGPMIVAIAVMIVTLFGVYSCATAG